MTARTYWKALLALLVCASVAGNVGHVMLADLAHPVPAGIAAAFPPLLLAAVVEGLALTVGATVRTWVYRAGVAFAAAIAAGAFFASYVALRDLAITLSFPPAVAPVVPLLADAGMAMATLMVLALRPAPVDVPVDVPDHRLDQQPVPVTDWRPPVDLASSVAAGQPVYQQRSTAAPVVTSADDQLSRHPLHLVSTAAGPGAAGAGPADAVEEQAQRLVREGVTRLAQDQVAEVLRCSARGASQRAIGRELSIDRRTVAGIVAAAAEEAEAEAVGV